MPTKSSSTADQSVPAAAQDKPKALEQGPTLKDKIWGVVKRITGRA